MFQDQKIALKNSYINQIKTLLPNGKQDGKNWVAINPRREDKSLGSFKINTETGVWADFATADEKGDILDLVCYLDNITIKELFKKHNITYKYKSLDDEYKKPTFFSQKHKKRADTVYTYYDTDGKTVLQYTCRFNFEDGRKEVLPYHLDPDLNYFCWKALPDPRPLYNLQNYNRKNVLIVEGEKTADAAQKILGDDWFVTTWSGGCKAVLKANWKMLESYEKIYIWPDNDVSGQNAAIEIKKILRSKASIVSLPENLHEKWDLADADEKEWTKARVIAQMEKENVKPKVKKKDHSEFRFLGKHRHKHYFLSFGEIYAFSTTDLKKINLMDLASKSYWEDNYRGGKGIDWDSAYNHILRVSKTLKFSPSKSLRGRGAWIDDGRFIYNTGDQILHENNYIELQDFDSKYIYQSSDSIELNTSKSLSMEESQEFFRIISSFSWNNKVSSILLLGWLVCAPICGALKWRSNIWLTGESGSGKSWIVRNIISKILEKVSISYESNTSEAAIRQDLCGDALPIIFDEFENADNQSAELISKVLKIARATSTENNARMSKGSNNNSNSIGYKFRTMFLFASINVSAKQTADINRLCILELNKAPRKNFHEKKISDYINDEFCDKFLTKILNNFETIYININIFRDRAGIFFDNQRKADQIGSLLGGAYSYLNDGIVSEEEADKFIQSNDYSDSQIEDNMNDSEKCLQYLMAYSIRIGLENIPIGTLINHVLGKIEFPNLLEGDPVFYLKAHGIIVEDKRIIIAYRHPKLDSIFSNTQFSVGYSGILKRINGAISVGEKRFGGRIRTSAWSLPFED